MRGLCALILTGSWRYMYMYINRLLTYLLWLIPFPAETMRTPVIFVEKCMLVVDWHLEWRIHKFVKEGAGRKAMWQPRPVLSQIHVINHTRFIPGKGRLTEKQIRGQQGVAAPIVTLPLNPPLWAITFKCRRFCSPLISHNLPGFSRNFHVNFDYRSSFRSFVNRLLRKLGPCESYFFVRIKSRIESAIRFVFESNLRIESAVYTTQAVTQPDGLQAYRTGL